MKVFERFLNVQHLVIYCISAHYFGQEALKYVCGKGYNLVYKKTLLISQLRLKA